MKALVTGITGQDGAYLAQLLLSKGYEVTGLAPYRSTPNLWRLEYLGIADKIKLVPGDVTDAGCVDRVIAQTLPTEIYNLAAQSFVAASFTQPSLTMSVNAIGTINILEAIRNRTPTTRFYQASTSEMFGLPEDPGARTQQNEDTIFHPRSPYGVAKLAAHWATINYREAYGLHASCGILFNHESPLRGDDFVTQKVAKAVARIKRGDQKFVTLGNTKSFRDWGHAKDFVRAMWLILQQDAPDDYVIATGKAHTVDEMTQIAFGWAGLNPTDHIRIDPELYRPTEVPYLRGDSRFAQVQLGWKPEVSFEDLIIEMVEAQYAT